MFDILEINEFFAEGNQPERSHVLLHITEPATPEEKEKGYFFAVVEINNGSIEQIEHLQQMIDDLESGYYETDEQPSSRAQAEGGDKNPLEITLEYINRRGHHILQYKNSLTHCLVGVLRNQELSFTYHGSPQAILFYQGKEGIEELNVLEEQKTEPVAGQLFPTLIQGNINTGDYFYIATPHVVDYFNYDRIKKILTSRTTKQAASHIQKVLGDVSSDLSFGGIIFHFPTRTDMPKTRPQPKITGASSAKSLDNLINKERSTEEILSPSLFSNIKKKMQVYQTSRLEKEKRKKLEKTQEKRQKQLAINEKGRIETNFRPREQKEPMANAILVGLGKALVNFVVGIYKTIKKTLVLTGKGAIALILLITNKDQKRQEIIDFLKETMLQKKEEFINLPLINKILLTATLVLALIFIGSLTFIKVKTTYNARQQLYNNQIQAVIDKKNAAEASILYGDEEKAFTLLQEAKGLINQLSKKNKKEELFNDVEAVLMKLRHLETVSPEVIADLSAANPEARAKKLVVIDNNLIAYGDEDISLYKINLATKKVEIKEHKMIPKLFNANTPKEQDRIVFLTSDASVAEYNKETSALSAKDIIFPTNNTKIAAIFVYNRRLYSLDTANNQIYKHSQTQSGFDKGVEWIKSKDVDLKDGVSLAIDGDLFVLKQNGEILKLVNGERQEFKISGLDPMLDKPTVIWTYNNVNNIYILEPTNKRVVVLNKNGKLIKQYTAPEWQNPTGIAINETDKVGYVLDSNKIYRFKF